MPSSRSVTRSAPPTFLGLAGHPIRWRLLVELAHSDRQVDEITALVGQPQNLVSYHLGRLRAGGLVSARRSSKDGRAVYYRAELGQCGASLTATGAALHPGLDLSQPSVWLPPDGRHRDPVHVLFVCTGNSSRSQIAEALLQHIGGERVEVASAGSAPKAVHPNAVKVLAVRGIDISDRCSKPLTQFTGQRFDYVVTLCDKVRERCPKFAGAGVVIHWSMTDPSHPAGSDRATYPRFRQTLDELETRIGFLIPVIDNANTQGAHQHD